MKRRTKDGSQFPDERQEEIPPDVLSINSIKTLPPAQVHSSHLLGTPAQTHDQQAWFVCFLNTYIFGCADSQLQHVGSSSLTRDQTQDPCIGTWSLSLYHPGNPSTALILNNLISLCFSTLFILGPWCFASRACGLPGFNLDLPDDVLFSSPAVLSLQFWQGVGSSHPGSGLT